MSRIGKQIITLPQNTEITISDGLIVVKGPLGSIEKKLHPYVEVKVDGNEITVHPKRNSNDARALWGTFASHISNMVAGVNKLYEKKLILEGVGFKSKVQPASPHEGSGADGSNKIVFALGFSHPVEVVIPEGLTVTAEKNIISVSGLNKEEVGSFAAKVRSLKKPEPYKGKGMRYEKEVIKRKQGKKSV